MSTIRDLVAIIGRLATAPSIRPLAEAAQRAATKTTSQLVMAGVPMRATVSQGSTRVTIRLVQFGPLTKSFGSTGPMELLRTNLATELPQATAELLDRILGAVS